VERALEGVESEVEQKGRVSRRASQESFGVGSAPAGLEEPLREQSSPVEELVQAESTATDSDAVSEAPAVDVVVTAPSDEDATDTIPITSPSEADDHVNPFDSPNDPPSPVDLNIINPPVTGYSVEEELVDSEVPAVEDADASSEQHSDLESTVTLAQREPPVSDAAAVSLPDPEPQEEVDTFLLPAAPAPSPATAARAVDDEDLVVVDGGSDGAWSEVEA